MHKHASILVTCEYKNKNTNFTVCGKAAATHTQYQQANHEQYTVRRPAMS
jgi:hypothetical protein